MAQVAWHEQDNVQAHHRCPIIRTRRVPAWVRHRSPLSACSRWGTAPAAGALGSMHMPEVVLTSRPSIAAHTARVGLGVVQAAAAPLAYIQGDGQHCRITHSWQKAPGEEYSVASFTTEALQSHSPHTAAYNQIWDLLFQQLERDSSP